MSHSSCLMPALPTQDHHSSDGFTVKCLNVRMSVFSSRTSIGPLCKGCKTLLNCAPGQWSQAQHAMIKSKHSSAQWSFPVPKGGFMLSYWAILPSPQRNASLLRISHKILNIYLLMCACLENIQWSGHDAIRRQMQTSVRPLGAGSLGRGENK